MTFTARPHIGLHFNHDGIAYQVSAISQTHIIGTRCSVVGEPKRASDLVTIKRDRS